MRLKQSIILKKKYQILFLFVFVPIIDFFCSYCKKKRGDFCTCLLEKNKAGKGRHLSSPIMAAGHSLINLEAFWYADDAAFFVVSFTSR